MITKTDQEITVTGKYKISLGVETEVLHPYQSGLEIEVKLVLWLMTTKNAVEIWGGVVCYIMMATKTDQEIIVSRKYKSGLETEVQRFVPSGNRGVCKLLLYGNKKCTRRCIV